MGEACNICGAKALKGGGMPVDGKMYCYRCIVRAVNSHDALVAACEAVLAEHDMFVGKDCGCGVFAQVSAALALAKK